MCVCTRSCQTLGKHSCKEGEASRMISLSVFCYSTMMMCYYRISASIAQVISLFLPVPPEPRYPRHKPIQYIADFSAKPSRCDRIKKTEGSTSEVRAFKKTSSSPASSSSSFAFPVSFPFAAVHQRREQRLTFFLFLPFVRIIIHNLPGQQTRRTQ